VEAVRAATAAPRTATTERAQASGLTLRGAVRTRDDRSVASAPLPLIMVGRSPSSVQPRSKAGCPACGECAVSSSWRPAP
jgi:hypothetical protein